MALDALQVSVTCDPDGTLPALALNVSVGGVTGGVTGGVEPPEPLVEPAPRGTIAQTA